MVDGMNIGNHESIESTRIDKAPRSTETQIVFDVNDH